ncbi:hypothetical protein HON52_01890 [Candidatus Uhrbacteria bacterium]|jgi:hypothetical protein|nr:hypothetical protein [Candidatus Uhrbacteria bacterium]
MRKRRQPSYEQKRANEIRIRSQEEKTRKDEDLAKALITVLFLIGGTMLGGLFFLMMITG